MYFKFILIYPFLVVNQQRITNNPLINTSKTNKIIGTVYGGESEGNISQSLATY